jgi:hypothetical protein
MFTAEYGRYRGHARIGSDAMVVLGATWWALVHTLDGLGTRGREAWCDGSRTRQVGSVEAEGQFS